jgi:hypothetical protein
MRRRNRKQGAQRGIRLRLTRCGQYIDHMNVNPVFQQRPGKAGRNYRVCGLFVYE